MLSWLRSLFTRRPAAPIRKSARPGSAKRSAPSPKRKAGKAKPKPPASAPGASAQGRRATDGDAGPRKSPFSERRAGADRRAGGVGGRRATDAYPDPMAEARAVAADPVDDPVEAPKAATPASSPATEEEWDGLPAMPTPRRGGGLESEATVSQSLRSRQQAIVDRIGERVEQGKFELPHLPSTSMVVMELAANPSSEIAQIVSSLSTDPVLSTRLLRLANSALYASQEPAETLHEAVMRVGMRELRSLIFALSMRQVIFRTEHLTSYAEETWRQSYSVGVIARSIGPLLGMEADKAFLIGLLHDVGKISLLAMMQREIEKPSDVTPALVGRIFMKFHEAAGAAMAKGWKLSEEFVEVAGCHHDFESNEKYGRSAAIVSLAHRLDLNLSIGDSMFWSTPSYPQFDYLGVPENVQRNVTQTAYETFMEQGEGDPTEAAPAKTNEDAA